MRRKFLSILLCVGMLLSVLTGFASAEGTPVFEISGTGVAGVDGTYNSVLDAIRAYYSSPDAQSGNCTMTLLADTTMEISTENSSIEGLAVGIYIAGAGSILDLGGHTLTVTGRGLDIDGYIIPAMAISTSSTSSPICVKNGTIVLNGSNMVGIVNGNNYLNVENVTILPGEQATQVTGVQNGMDPSGGLAGTVVKNCQIILGGDNTDVAGQAYADPGNDRFLQIQSGHFTKNPVSGESGAIRITVGSNAMTENPAGVDGTVITSSDTTAIIVQDGKAYTYDSLQDAVNAADKRAGEDGTVQVLLLKQPEGTTTIPADAPGITLKKLDENANITIGEIELKDSNGTPFSPSEDGKVELPPTPVKPVVPPIIPRPPFVLTMPGLPFTDVAESAWYYDAVEYVYDTGLMDGVGGGKFSPAGDTTRGMIVTILYRMEGSPRVCSDGAKWWSDARVWAMENGISDGTNMNGKITREQLAAMLYRYAKLSGADTSARANLNKFVDATSVSSWAFDAMQWAVGEGIIGGSNGKLNPKGLATRAEVAAMFMRLNKRIW